MPVAPPSLNAGQIRILGALLEDESILRGGELARRAGCRDLDQMAKDLPALIEAGLVHVAVPLDQDDIFYTVFALRPSDRALAEALVQRGSESLTQRAAGT